MSAIFDRQAGELLRAKKRDFDAAFEYLNARNLQHPWLKDYSLRRALTNQAAERRTGLEYEISQDFERTQPAQHGGLIVPFEVFTRADVVGTLSTGGYLVETLNLPAADALRPSMVVLQLGATLIPAPHGANVNLPNESSAASATWLSSETSTATESDPTFGQIAFSPHTVSAYTEFSRLLMLQGAPDPAEFVVRRDLIAVLGRAFDLAALFGSGIAGQPRGLAGMTGVSTFSGSSLSLTSVIGAAVALGDALDDSCGVATTKTLAGTLRERQEFSGSTKTLWQGSLIAGTCCDFPARSSSQITAGSLFIGSWEKLNVVCWGDGIEVMANPYGDYISGNKNFQKGIVGVRAFLTCDVAPTYPSAFNYAAAVT